jgi:hypothetical protein
VARAAAEEEKTMRDQPAIDRAGSIARPSTVL